MAQDCLGQEIKVDVVVTYPYLWGHSISVTSGFVSKINTNKEGKVTSIQVTRFEQWREINKLSATTLLRYDNFTVISMTKSEWLERNGIK